MRQAEGGGGGRAAELEAADVGRGVERWGHDADGSGVGGV